MFYFLFFYGIICNIKFLVRFLLEIIYFVLVNVYDVKNVFLIDGYKNLNIFFKNYR